MCETKQLSMAKMISICCVWTLASIVLLYQVETVYKTESVNPRSNEIASGCSNSLVLHSSRLDVPTGAMPGASQEINGSPRQVCKCSEQSGPQSKTQILSTCSIEASELGKGQKVISYSLYITEPKDSPMFFDAIQVLSEEIRILFPGWLIRIYSNVPIGNSRVCQTICREAALFWCDITNIPGMGNMSSLNGRAWRFLVLGDPTVEIFLVRDLDSQVTLRERVAVGEWEASSLTFHTIRDHPSHKVGMLGGMWGAKNYLLPPVLRKNLQRMILAEARVKLDKGWDQDLVIRHIYKPYHSMTLAHDSYSCGRYPDFKTLPFSVQRHGGEIIGLRNLGNASSVKYCPVKCRPVHGKHWKWC